MPIAPITAPAAIAPVQPLSAPAKPGAFASVLNDAISGVEQTQQNAATSINRFLSGEDEEVHKVALATQQAELNFDLFMQVRNKVISAYQEIMRMQV